MKLPLWFLLVMGIIASPNAYGTKLFIPMDATQKNHLKAYGITYSAIAAGSKVEWLLNYRGGSFVMEYSALLDTLCKHKGVSCKRMANTEYAAMVRKIKLPKFNGDVVALDKAPKIAVYTPSGKKPWDDAVTLALTYAEIPFDKLYVSEVMAGDLNKYDWLHLHHEDFTGQYGKFWTLFGNVDWYLADVKKTKKLAAKYGFDKVSQMQLAVAKKIREFVAAGGNLFAMCSATDTYDIALAANGVDICDTPYDGDAMDPDAQSKLDFSQCFAFTNFLIATDKDEYRLGSIDNTKAHSPNNEFGTDFFNLLSFPAKFDPVPTMLCQNHTKKIKGFLGLTTTFNNATLKPDVVVMADYKELNDAKYIHGRYMAGTWTFYGGHDPEDYRHTVGAAPTDIGKYPNSPGYRLILNNVLCPASGKKDVTAVICCDSIASKPSKKIEATLPPVSKSNVTITAGTSSNTLVISMTGNAENAAIPKKIERVIFINTAGKEMLNKQFSSTKVTIDMDGLPNGMYNIKVNGEYAGKVVKN